MFSETLVYPLFLLATRGPDRVVCDSIRLQFISVRRFPDMTFVTALTVCLAGARFVAIPAALVHHHLGTERLVSDIGRFGMVADGATVDLADGLCAGFVADITVDPGGRQVTGMWRDELPGTDLVVAFLAGGVVLRVVALVSKCYDADRGVEGNDARNFGFGCCGRGRDRLDPDSAASFNGTGWAISCQRASNSNPLNVGLFAL